MPRRWIANLLGFERQTPGALALLAAVALSAAAQTELDHWTIADGLPQNAINALTQTHDGYLWLATNDGLVRFDGLRFTVFKHSTTPGLATNRFRCLYEDRQGTLWAGSPESVLTRYRDGQFHSYTVKDGLPKDEIGKIDEDETGQLWLTGAEFGYVVAWRGGPVSVFRARDRLPGRYQVKSAGGNLLWSLSETGLHLLRHGQVLTLTARDGLPDLHINSVWADAQGSIWINARGGTVRLRQNQLSVAPRPPKQFAQALGICHFADGLGNFWYLSSGQVTRIKANHRTVYDKLTVSAFWEDREGAVWLGAQEGLYRYRQRPVHTLTEAPGPRYNVTLSIYSVLEDRQGDVWLGKWGSGVSRYHAGQFTHYVAGPVWQKALARARQRGDPTFDNYVYASGLADSRITTLYEDRAGLLWAGANGGPVCGVSQFKDGQWIPSPLSTG
jgi:ligand-binding sensor domain-containing protein